MKNIVGKIIIILLIFSFLFFSLNAADLTKVREVKYKTKTEEVGHWECLGKIRVTEYCPCCNDPSGYSSSSGKRLKYGYVACFWLPNGTKISIEGEIFYVEDYCGTDAIDIFVDTPDGCHCNLNKDLIVSVWKEN